MEINFRNIENKIFVIPDNSIPITYLSIVFLIGNYLEKPSNIGINNLCLKTLTRSNKNLSHDALSYYLEKNSISLSASGGNFTSSISLSFPFYSYNKALEILEEILFNYSFRKEDIDESKRDLINSIKLSKDDIWVYLNENSDTAFYNSFLSWDTRGNEKTLKEISRKNLIQWFEKYYLNKSIKKIIVISGYTNEKFEEKIYKKFNKILNYNHLYYDKMKDFEIIKAKKIHNLKKKEVGISLIYQAPSLSLDSIKFKIFNSILSSMSGRLFINIREKKELAYAITSIYDPIPFGKSNLKIMILTSKEKKNQAIESLNQEVENILKNGFTQEELEVSKNYTLGIFSSALQKRSFKSAIISKIKSFDISEEYLTEHINIIKNTSLEEINNLRSIFKETPAMFIVN